MKSTLITFLLLVLIAGGTACKKETKPCPPVGADPKPVMSVSLKDVNGHDLLNGAYKKYDTSEVKIYVTSQVYSQTTRGNVCWPFDSDITTPQIDLMVFCGHEGTYEVEIKGVITHVFSRTLESTIENCEIKFNIPQAVINGVVTPLKQNVLPLVYH